MIKRKMTNAKLYQIVKNNIGKNINDLQYDKGILIKFDTYMLMQISAGNAHVDVRVNNNNIIIEVI